MGEFVVILICLFVFGSQGYRSGTGSFELDGNSDQQMSLHEQVHKILSEQSDQRQESDTWNEYTSRTPEMVPFQNKIFDRLQKSQIFVNKPEIRQNLLKVALEKLKTCKPLQFNQVDKSCLGRSTGLIMQLIAAIEKANRDLPAQNY